MVKTCRDNLEKARKQASTTAQLVDEKHVTEALIQTNRFLASTTESLAKGDQFEKSRLEELEKAVAEQKAFMAKRTADCAAFLQQIAGTIAQLEGMKTHLQSKPTQPEVQEPPLTASDQSTTDVKLTELLKILAEAKLSTEVEKKLKEGVTAVMAPTLQPITYGKATPAGGVAAHAAASGPYQQQVEADGKKTGTVPAEQHDVK